MLFFKIFVSCFVLFAGFLKITVRGGWSGLEFTDTLLYNGADANAFLKFEEGSAPPKKIGKNVETRQIVIVKKVPTPPSERYLLNDGLQELNASPQCRGSGGCFPGKFLQVKEQSE